MSVPKKVVLPPSGATINGLERYSGDDKRVPSVAKRIGVPPPLDDVRSIAGSVPNSGV